MTTNIEYQLGELLIYEQPTKYIVNSTEYNDGYPIPVLTAGKSFILGYTNESDNVFDDLPVIIFDDFTTATQFVDFKFKVKSSAMKILHVNQDLVLPKFVFYKLQTISVDHSTHKRYWIQQYSKIKISIPTISEQEQIVKQIEESLSQLDSAVATLNKTKQQLEIYRQAVLKEEFDRIVNISRIIPIKDVCTDIKVGIVIKPAQYYTGSQNSIKAFRSANVKEFMVNDSDWVYITKEGHEKNKRSEIHTNDVLIVRSGYPGTACVVPERFNGCNAIDILIAVPNTNIVNPDYLCAYTNSPYGKRLVREKKRGVAQAHLNVSGYSRMNIMIPDLDVQKDVVKEINSQVTQVDSILETVNGLLLQTEALRQSILKQAFEVE